MPILRTALLTAILTGVPAMAVAAEFVFVPVPRWQSPPETEEVCAVVRQECPAYAGTTDIEAEFGLVALRARLQASAAGSVAGQVEVPALDHL